MVIRHLSRRLVAVALTLLLVALPCPAITSNVHARVALPPHPLHTSISDVVHDRAKQSLILTVRVFAEDFLAVLPLHAESNGTRAAARKSDWHPAAKAYLARTITVRDARGNSLAVALCGITEAGDVLLVCARVHSVAEVRGLQIRNTILFEKFEDQLSIVRVTARDRTQTFILTRKSDSARLR